jgi:hypothetical protein
VRRIAIALAALVLVTVLLDPYTFLRSASDAIVRAPWWQLSFGLLDASLVACGLALVWGRRFEVTFTALERCCQAAAACCLNAVRYGGRKRAIIRKLGNNPDVCDYIVAWWGGVVRAWPAPRAWQLRR